MYYIQVIFSFTNYCMSQLSYAMNDVVIPRSRANLPSVRDAGRCKFECAAAPV